MKTPSPKITLPHCLALAWLAVSALPLAAAPESGGTYLGPELPPATPAPTQVSFFRGFEPDSRYDLWIDGAWADESRIYLATRAGSSMLLLDPSIPGGLLLQPRHRSVGRVTKDTIVEELDGTLALRGDRDASVGTNFEIGPQGIHFTLDEKKIELRRAPDMLGFAKGSELLTDNHSYAFKARGFVPDTSALETLAEAPGDVTVRVFFGSWCSSCSRRVPRMLRLEKELAGKGPKFEFYGLAHAFRNEPQASKFKIRAVPTAVVLRGEEETEIGRLRGAPWKQPGVSIVEVLRKNGLLPPAP